MGLCNTRVPVVGNDGKPRMPTKSSRARRWIAQGKAVAKCSKLGIFYVQLTRDAGCHIQDIGLGLDPGSKYDGIAIVSKKEVVQTGMTELPQGITKKLEQPATSAEIDGVETADEENAALITAHVRKTGWHPARNQK